jgi:hypothetical protein
MTYSTAAPGEPADHLDDPVRDQFGPFETVGDRKAERDGGIEVAAGNSADGKGQGQDGQSECESNADKSDTELRKTRSQHGAAAASKYQPKGSEEFRSEFPRHRSLLYDPSQASVGILRDFHAGRIAPAAVQRRPQPWRSPKNQPRINALDSMAASQACPTPQRWL